MTETIPHNNKRGHKRYGGVYAEYALIQSAEDEENAQFQHCFIRDVSLSGSGIFITERIPDYSFVLMRIYDPNFSQPIVAFGGIAWSHLSEESPSGRPRYNVGIKFLRVQDEHQKRLKRMVNHFESLEHRQHPSIRDLIP